MDLGGGGLVFLSGIRPHADPKGPSLYYFEITLFWLTHPKIFVMAPSASKYTNFEGRARRRKRNFLVKNFQKSFKTNFFKILPAAQKIWLIWGLHRNLRELKKSIWSTYKKFFENPPPPPEKLLDPPLQMTLKKNFFY